MPAPKIRIKAVTKYLDMDALRDLAAHQLEAGHGRDEVIDEIVEMIDSLVPWALIIPGPVGAVVELLDGPVARAIARLVVNLAEVMPKAKHPPKG